jgi:hypothetical protein
MHSSACYQIPAMQTPPQWASGVPGNIDTDQFAVAQDGWRTALGEEAIDTLMFPTLQDNPTLSVASERVTPRHQFAVEGLSDTLRMELLQFGIDVVIIQPGAIISEWNGIARTQLMKYSGSGAYADSAHAYVKLMMGARRQKKVSV